MCSKLVDVGNRLLGVFNALVDRVADASLSGNSTDRQNPIANQYTNPVGKTWEEPRLSDTLGKE